MYIILNGLFIVITGKSQSALPIVVITVVIVTYGSKEHSFGFRNKLNNLSHSDRQAIG